jgi:hypothetical protein
VSPHTASTIEPYRAPAIAPHTGTPTRADQRVEPVSGGRGMRLITNDDLERMHRNDVKAGRTRESMSKGDSSQPPAARNPNPYNDPYNTGGWNYNTNQSASPIWNPNSQ